ncbi:hypothetical protein ABZ477_17070 [Microbacterium sp. NPDC019599]|uniref:hypothetical protein n=1 Tax=Microbacterium sp. NPDC019599 TaxID=3154690 RepID=UPI0033DDFF4B
MNAIRIPLAVAAIVAMAGSTGCTPAAQATDGPAEFQSRAQLPSCGTVELDQGDSIPSDALDCVADAGDDGAELVVVAPTVEGDPITTYYRILPQGGWEVFTDMSEDSFGGGWSHALCPDAVSMDDMGTCTDEPME